MLLGKSFVLSAYLVPAHVYLSKASFANLIAHYEMADGPSVGPPRAGRRLILTTRHGFPNELVDDRKLANVDVSPRAYKNRGSGGAVGVVM